MEIERRTVLRGAAGGVIAGTFGTAAPALGRQHERRRTVFVAGDSTAATYAVADRPQAGWGQALPVFLRRHVGVVNEALSGASSKSFVDLGRLDRIRAAIGPGDVLLISFGHNDEKIEDPARYTEPWTTFHDYLRLYLDAAHAARATPILVTPVERRRFTAAGAPYLTHGEYPDAMRALAESTGTSLIDLTRSSFALWGELGPEATKECFLWLAPGESPNHPNGVSDNTHFQAHGAIEVARLVVADGRRIPGRDECALERPSYPDDALEWPPARPAET